MQNQQTTKPKPTRDRSQTLKSTSTNQKCCPVRYWSDNCRLCGPIDSDSLLIFSLYSLTVYTIYSIYYMVYVANACIAHQTFMLLTKCLMKTFALLHATAHHTNTHTHTRIHAHTHKQQTTNNKQTTS